MSARHESGRAAPETTGWRAVGGRLHLHGVGRLRQLSLLDAQYGITEETLESRESSLELVSLRLEQGVANKVDYYQSESLVLETAGTLPAIEQAIERAGTKAGNAGFKAGLSAIEMVSLFNALEG